MNANRSYRMTVVTPGVMRLNRQSHRVSQGRALSTMRITLPLGALFILCYGSARAEQQPQPPGPQAACKADVAKLCPGVKPGGGRILDCLKQNQAQVSTACKEALAKRAAEKEASPPNSPPPQ